MCLPVAKQAARAGRRNQWPGEGGEQHQCAHVSCPVARLPSKIRHQLCLAQKHLTECNASLWRDKNEL